MRDVYVNVPLDDDLSDSCGMPLNDAIRVLLRARRGVPREHRQLVRFRAYSTDDCGDCSTYIECGYRRPQTDAEITAEIAADAKQKHLQRVLEYQQFLTLQAKFAKKDDAP